jgi:hypothetical protein
LADGLTRTTFGAETVFTWRATGARTSPSSVWAPATVTVNVVLTGRRWRGVKVQLVPSRLQVVGAIEPSITGLARRPAATDAAVTGRENVIVKLVSMATRSPRGRVAWIRPDEAARVRKAARAGLARGWPDSARAPGSTVTEWSVSGSQLSCGRIVRVRPVASQLRSTSRAGTTRSAAATESRSIGVLNRTVSGSSRD